jgi:hypothetical protein
MAKGADAGAKSATLEVIAATEPVGAAAAVDGEQSLVAAE